MATHRTATRTPVMTSTPMTSTRMTSTQMPGEHGIRGWRRASRAPRTGAGVWTGRPSTRIPAPTRGSDRPRRPLPVIRGSRILATARDHPRHQLARPTHGRQPTRANPILDTPISVTPTRATQTRHTPTHGRLTRARLTQARLTHARLTGDTPTHDGLTRDMPTRDTRTRTMLTRDMPTRDTRTRGMSTSDTSARGRLTHGLPIPGSPIPDSMTPDLLPTPDTQTCVPERAKPPRRAILGPVPDPAQPSTGDRRRRRRERSRTAAWPLRRPAVQMQGPPRTSARCATTTRPRSRGPTCEATLTP
jgi:hypothetical protein